MKCFLSGEVTSCYINIQTDFLGQVFLELFQFKTRSLFFLEHPVAYSRNFSFIKHFVEFLGGREITVVFQEMQSVSTSYILKAPQPLRIAFQS